MKIGTVIIFWVATILMGCKAPTLPPMQPAAARINSEPDIAQKKVQKSHPRQGAKAFVDSVKKAIEQAILERPDDAEYFGWGKNLGNEWNLPLDWCRQNLSVVEPIEECTMLEHAGGKAAVFYVTGECQEWCDISSWLVLDDRGPQKVSSQLMPDEDLAGMIVLSDLTFGFTGGVELCGPNEYCATLTRLDLSHMTTTSWTECGNPSFSPDEKWVVCRAANGDVLRLPIGGGEFEKVFSFDKTIPIQAGPETGVGVYPVIFEDDSTIRIRTQTPEAMHQIAVPWVQSYIVN